MEEDEHSQIGVPEEMQQGLGGAVEAVSACEAWAQLRSTTQRARGMFPREIGLCANQVAENWGWITEVVDSTGTLAEAIAREETDEAMDWQSMDRRSLRLMANQHPIGYIRAHRAIFREEYAEIIQRNRVDQERESPQEEEGSYVGEAFDEPPDEEYQALLMESQGVPVGEVEGSVVESAHRRGRKARKDLAGFQGEVDWTLSTELYRKWQRKLQKKHHRRAG